VIRRLAGLRRDWRSHLALAAATAVAAATLTGALVIGDSVRASLRRSALEGLGSITHLVRLEGSFPRDLATRLAPALESAQVAPLAAARAAVRVPDGSGATDVDTIGVSRELLALFELDPTASPWRELLEAEEARGVVPVVIDETLARELGVETEGTVIATVPRWSEIPSGSLLARRDVESRVRTVRAKVVAVVPDRGLARLGLGSATGPAPTLLLPLGRLATLLDRPGRADTLAFALAPGQDGGAIEAALRSVATLDDLGLELAPTAAGVQLTSREIVLRPALVGAATAVAEQRGWRVREVITGLANRVQVGERSIGYATITAMSPLDDPPPDEALVAAPGQDEQGVLVWPQAGGVVVEASTAARLDAAPWDPLRFEYWKLGDGDLLVEDQMELVIDAVSTIEGVGADPSLAPMVPGIADAETMGDWDPPFPVDLDRVTPEDEAWWEARRATPKLFVSLTDARRAWASRWGSVTALRMLGQVDLPTLDRDLVTALPLAAVGATPQAVRAQALERAQGSTDFTGLFIGFGLFLLVAALLLVALLFGLLAARRGADLGLLLAVGWPLAKVRRLLLAEGAVVAAAGAAAGAALGVGWTRLLLYLLTTRWNAAIGGAELELAVEPRSLVIAAVSTWVLAVVSLRWSLRELGAITPLALLRGRLADLGSAAPSRGRLLLAAGGAVGALGLAGGAAATTANPAGLAFGAGALALMAGMFATGWWVRRHRSGWIASSRGGSLARLSFSASRRAPRRASLLVGLVAAASFVVLVVAASTPKAVTVDHGAAGFELLGSASLALPPGFENPAVREELGFSAEDEEVLAGVTLVPIRASSGDDASCLTLGKPLQPRVLGVPLGRFAERALPTTKTLDGRSAHELLAMAEVGGGIPALGDAEAVQWILRSGLGKSLQVGADGQEVVIAGMLDHSAFQGELLVSEANFLRLFPTAGGFQALLVDVPADRDLAAVAGVLENRLADFGLEVITTSGRLEAYRAVTQTWLDTFRALGGLGLLLGVLGVAVLIARAGVERRDELDALVAFGWRRSLLVTVLALEHALLVTLGLVVGLGAALLATAPARGLSGALPAIGATTPLLVGLVVLAIGVSAMAARGVARERAGRD
jgi:ABC-type lipoprotein release transport system permease subunit